MKKKIALLLAAIMIFAAAIPMHVFAASGHEVTYIYTNVGDDTLLTNNSLAEGIGFHVAQSEGNLGSYLRIQPTKNIAANAEFDLVLSNAKWAFAESMEELYYSYFDRDTFKSDWTDWDSAILPYNNGLGTYTASNMTYTQAGAALQTHITAFVPQYNPVSQAGYTLQVSDRDASKAHIKTDAVLVYDAANPEKCAELWIPIVVVADDSTKPVTITLTGRQGPGTDFTAFNNSLVADVPGEASLKLDSVVTSRDVFDLDTLVITEKKYNDLVDDGFFYLIAPDGFIWGSKSESAEITGENIGVSTVTGSFDILNSSNVDNYWIYVKDEKVKVVDPGQVLEVKVDFARASNKYSAQFYIDGLRLVSDDNAKFGKDLPIRVVDAENVEIYALARKGAPGPNNQANPDISETLGFGVATSKPYYKDLPAITRVDWGIDFYRSEDYNKGEVVKIWAGREEQLANEVVFEEKAPVSWWAENITDFNLVDAEGNSLAGKVKIEEVEITDEDNLEYGLADVTQVPQKTGLTRANAYTFSIYNDPVKDSEYNQGMVAFQMTISAAASYAGPVYLQASGRGIPTGSTVAPLQIAEILAPVVVTTKTTYVEVGYQTVAVADISVKEAAAGVFDKGETVDIALEAFGNIFVAGNTDVQFIDATKVELVRDNTEGLLGKPMLGNSTMISVPVNRVSTEEGMAFTLKGLKVYLNRAVPEGAYDVSVGGLAFVDNWQELVNEANVNHAGKFTNWGVVSPNYIEVKTAGLNKALSKNVVVTTETPNVAVVDGVNEALAAPIYIDVVTGRTMVPINFISQALGIEAKNVIWNATERKVIVVTAERTVEFYIDTNKFTINGAAQYMLENGVQVMSVINPTNDRSYIPFTYLAQAFGITVAWDSAKKLAIYNPTLEQKNNGAVVIDSIPTFTAQ